MEEKDIQNVKKLQLVSVIALITGCMGVLGGIPQAVAAMQGNIDSLNILTWTMWFLAGGVMLYYSVVHKKATLIVVNTGWSLLHFIVLTSIIYYSYITPPLTGGS